MFEWEERYRRRWELVLRTTLLLKPLAGTDREIKDLTDLFTALPESPSTGGSATIRASQWLEAVEDALELSRELLERARRYPAARVDDIAALLDAISEEIANGSARLG